ncbi:hypothetical protein KDX27_40750 [Burkholderia cenocepacia]|uniref:hypothetical protein n=1 Tax=Burkholderia cenocepacia TaxID=95486 RepID=UPI001B98A1EA|nr:hypothetical protein [Burkholderia cenocepacia]MBR8030137.1 hypothetical protein [Burkholderia cenocepacia]MBR8174015.1 hypothetical protein [Burkholderia cenocepacia]
MTLYEVQTLQALERKEYADLVNAPTPWSASMRTSFRNFERQPTEVVADYGVGNGGKLSIVRLVSKTPIEQHNNFGKTVESLFQKLQTGETCAVRLRVGRTVSGGPQALANVRPPVIGHEYLWVVESVDVSPREFKAQFLSACQTAGLVHDENDATYFGYFEFLSEVDHKAVQSGDRPSPRMDLMKNFTDVGGE